MITGTQIVAHLVGDYLLQSDWMANEKTKYSFPAIIHSLFYTLPFLFITLSWKPLVLILLSHFIIDRFRLARYVCWAKNVVATKQYRYKWNDCEATGYHKDRPPWLSVWLMIIADNTLHLIINSLVLYYIK